MADNPGDEQRWIPSNEELPGGGTPKPEGIPGADEPTTQWDTPAAQPTAPGPGSYPQPGGGQSSGKATASLVLGILGFLLCPLVCSVLAIVFGYSARNEINASGGQIGGRGLAVAGIVLGWIGIAFCVLAIILFIALIAIGAAVEDSDIFDITTNDVGHRAVVLRPLAQVRSRNGR